ncbi:hypothetical protein EZS27_011815 [termite gut metagenome]|uniref:Outer membrane protein beta-barrel domain-containing protein n=1 Tax=termite gut metagenome TaxID=433724 RepID=A0A5J4S2R4_9ZZZZ
MISPKRKALILFLGIVVVCSSVDAQVGELRQNISIGFNGGVNLNSVIFSPRIKQSQMTGFNGGLTARFISEKYFAMICGLQMELNYSERGWKEQVEDETGDTYNRSMNYVEIPFLAHLAFGNDDGAQFFLNLGPQASLLLNEQENKSPSWHPEQRRVSEQYDKPADSKFDYGLAFGAGLEVKTKAGNFLIEGRYYYGLADFYNNSKKDYFGRSAHTVISGKITYLFDLKK